MLLLAVACILSSCGKDNEHITDPAANKNPLISLTDDNGDTVDRIDAFGSANIVAVDLTPNTFYDIQLFTAAHELIAKYRLITDAQGKLPETPFAFDLDIGTYNLDIVGTGKSFSFEVQPPDTSYILVCDEVGAHQNNFTEGQTVYIIGDYLVPGDAAAYVVDDRHNWTYGDILYDYGDGANTVTIAADSSLARQFGMVVRTASALISMLFSI